MLHKLGPVELTRAFGSYLAAQTRPKGNEETFEDWVSNRFGRRLFELFFRSYTEKVWGVPTSEIRAEWAAQRIKGLSFVSAAKAAFFGNEGNKVKSLIQEFHYPRYGPGQMWETMTDEIRALGGEVRLETPVSSSRSRTAVSPRSSQAGIVRAWPGDLVPPAPHDGRVDAPARARRGAGGLAWAPVPRLPHGGARARRRGPLPRQLDLHPRAERPRRPDPELPLLEPVDGPGPVEGLRRARVLLLRRRRALVDGDEDLVELATRELEELGLATRRRSSADTPSASRRRIRCTTRTTRSGSTTIREWLEAIENLQQVGRNGLHRYNNSDHSMLTAIRAVENAVLGQQHDIWAVNAESVYHEEDVRTSTRTATLPETPDMKQDPVRSTAR